MTDDSSPSRISLERPPNYKRKNNIDAPHLSLERPPNYKQKDHVTQPCDADIGKTPFQVSDHEKSDPTSEFAVRAPSHDTAASSGLDALEVLTNVREFCGAGRVTETFINNDILYFVNEFYPSE